MSVTSSNRQLIKSLRKELACFAKKTGGLVEERRTKNATVLSKYSWPGESGEIFFIMNWHSSVSDRFFPKRVKTEIRRKIVRILPYISSPEDTLNKATDKFYRGNF